MIGRVTLASLVALSLALGANLAGANNDRQTTGDILLIEKVMERMVRDLPGNGLSMAEVEQRFGSPMERSPAVGEPPITRWTYGDYSVYFEHSLVIESVLHHEAVIREVADVRN